MLEYTNKYWKMFVPMIKKSLVKRFGKDETVKLLEKTDGIYRDMLNRANDIGKDNPMASNMYECLIFLALRKSHQNKRSLRKKGDFTLFEQMSILAKVLIFVSIRKYSFLYNVRLL